MSNELKVTVVQYEEFVGMDFIAPATYFIMDSLQNYVFIHTRDRSKAQDYIDEHYGKNRYKVVASKLQKGKGDITCRGNQTVRGQRK